MNSKLLTANGALRHLAIPLLMLFCASASIAGSIQDFAQNIAPLIDPAKLMTLKERGANPQVQKYVYWLVLSEREQVSAEKVAAESLRLAGYSGEAEKLTKAAMLRNLRIARKLGADDAEGMSEMRKGNAATVRTGPYTGDQLSVDHIVPRSVCVELDNVIANLELMPQRKNSSKNAKIGRRQKDVARKLHKAGLLSEQGLKSVEGEGNPVSFR